MEYAFFDQFSFLLGYRAIQTTKYNSTMGNLAAPDIIKRLEKSKAIKYARSIGYHYATAKAKYAGMNVKGQA